MTLDADQIAHMTTSEPPSKQEQPHSCAAYTELKRLFRDIGRLEAIGEILGRDFLTAMPEGAYQSRLNQISYLYRRVHEDIVCTNVRQYLDTAIEHLDAHPDDWDAWDTSNLRQMKAVIDEHSLLNEELMEHIAKVANEGRRVHRDVLRNNDWDMAREHLQEVIDIERRLADKKMKAKGADSHYDAMLRDYCHGFTLADVEKWFDTLEKEITGLLPKILERQNTRDEPIPLADFFPVENQMWLNEEMLALLGFDFERGGLYQTGHNPVEGGTPDDTRLVIKSVDTTNFMDSLKSAMHEAGHGLYIQGLPRQAWRYQPVAKDMGAAMQESQALLVEMLLGRTREFYSFLSPRLEGLFHSMRDESLSARNLHALKTWVKPTPDRKRADEVTYFYHILLRFRIERDLIEGRMKVEDIPERWTEELHGMLGVLPQNHMQGVLQDVHWFVAKFGYFPSYTLGHMIAAQLYETLQNDMPKLFTHIRRGEFVPITRWLQDNIHSKGRLVDPKTLLREVTGSDPSPDFLIAHFESRYLSDM